MDRPRRRSSASRRAAPAICQRWLDLAGDRVDQRGDAPGPRRWAPRPRVSVERDLIEAGRAVARLARSAHRHRLGRRLVGQQAVGDLVEVLLVGFGLSGAAWASCTGTGAATSALGAGSGSGSATSGCGAGIGLRSAARARAARRFGCGLGLGRRLASGSGTGSGGASLACGSGCGAGSGCCCAVSAAAARLRSSGLAWGTGGRRGDLIDSVTSSTSMVGSVRRHVVQQLRQTDDRSDDQHAWRRDRQRDAGAPARPSPPSCASSGSSAISATWVKPAWLSAPITVITSP